ncbi:hypothetical protein HDU67_006672 [Dinochytrium kinnereticum]|nr:hypothetical protein HDU67_006672 [Dinochytrium kinnereticum]
MDSPIKYPPHSPPDLPPVTHRKRSSSLPSPTNLASFILTPLLSVTSSFLGAPTPKEDDEESPQTAQSGGAGWVGNLRSASPSTGDGEVAGWGAGGLTSDSFDTSRPGHGADQRDGFALSEIQEIERIMKERSVSFDEARYIHVEWKLISNGIDPATGLPMNDPRAVTFDSFRGGRVASDRRALV